MGALLFPRRAATCLLALASAAALATPALSGPGAVQAAAASGEMLLRRDGGVATLQLPSGGEVALSLPPHAEIASVAGQPHAWAAVGTTPEREGSSRLVVLFGDEDGARRLPPVPATSARLQTQPVALVSESGLAAVAWLDGDDRGGLAVRAAAWEDGRWGSAEEVAPRGPGSQLALAGVVLDDGSWLLVWSAFDGEDDEIFWSRRGDEGWSTPRRLAADNGVPDITPALTAVRGGALAAWSWYDGDTYRVVTARLAGAAWSVPEVAGPEGSLYPSFAAAAAGSSYLLYQLAEPRGWEVVEVDPSGVRQRYSGVAGSGSERPLVLAAGKDEVRLVFTAVEAIVPWFPLP